MIPDDPYVLTEGPLPKSVYTYQLEEVTRQLLMDQVFTFSTENGNAFITINNIKYNWTDMIKYADFDHIELNGNDCYLYSKYYRSLPKQPELLNPDYEIRYRQELYQDYLINHQALPDPIISFQEMQAINIYTSGFYQTMNALLRGELDNPSKKAIIQSVFCASGLRKIPFTSLTDAFRGGKMPSVDEHNARVNAAKKHGVIQLSGFVSSSIDKAASFQDKPVHFHFTNLKGLYIAPISQMPEEKEFLIPPTQVQLNNYQFTNEKHCFEGQLVSDLASKNTRSLEMGCPTGLMRPTYMEPELSQINTMNKLREQIQNLSPEHCRSLCENKKELIDTPEKLFSLLEFISSEKRQIVYEIMIKDSRLIEMIKSATDFDHTLRYLTPEQCQSVFNAMRDKLSALIQTSQDLGQVLQYLSGPQCTAVCEATKNTLLTHCKLDIIFPYLTLEQRTAVLGVWKDQLPNMIKSNKDLIKLLTNLTPIECKTICKMIQDKFPAIIKSFADFSEVMELPLEQSTVFFEMFKHALPGIIKSVPHFKEMKELLTSEEGKVAFEVMKTQLLPIINTISDVTEMKSCLSAQQCVEFVAIIYPKLPSLIKSGLDFTSIMNLLGPDQEDDFFELMKDKLPGIIQSRNGAFYIRQSLNSEQCEIVNNLKQLMDSLAGAASNKEILEFSSALMSDSSERIKTQFSHILKKPMPSVNLIKTLSTLESSWLEKINKAAGLNLTTDQLHSQTEVETRINQYVAGTIPAIVITYPESMKLTSAQELRDKLILMTPDECKSVFKVNKNVIKSAQDLASLLQFLSPQQRCTIFEILSKDNGLTPLVRSSDDLINVLMFLSPLQCNQLCKSMENQLPAIIKSGIELSKIEHYLSPEQGAAVYEGTSKLRMLYSMDKVIVDFQIKAAIFLTQTKDMPKFNQIVAEINLLSNYLKTNWPDKQTSYSNLDAVLNSKILNTLLINAEANIDRKTGIKNLPILRELNKGFKIMKKVMFDNRPTQNNHNKAKQLKDIFIDLKESLDKISQKKNEMVQEVKPKC